MDPGAYRYEVVLEREVKGQRNQYNERSPSGWVEVEPMRVAIEPIKSREKFVANQTHAEITHRVRYWRNENVTEDKRFRWQDGDNVRYLYVSSVTGMDHYNLQQEAEAVERR